MTKGIHHSRSLKTFTLFLILACSASARAQTSSSREEIVPQLNLTQVMDKLAEKNVERAEALQKYQNRRYYNLDYTGFPTSFHAEMVVDMVYDAPGTKQFKIVSQKGPQWIIDRILKRLLDAEQEALTEENRERVAITTSNYGFSGFNREDSPENCAYTVSLEPKIPNKLLFRGRIWVDGKDFAVCRIEAEPAKNPSFWIRKTEIHHSYLKVGDFWLPAENKSVSAIRGGGTAILTIKYQDYEILSARGLKNEDSRTSSSLLALPPH